MRCTPRFLAAILAALLGCSAANAAEVLYSFLDPEGDNVFDVFVEVTGDDTLGLATYNVQLDGLDGFEIDSEGVSFTPNTLAGMRADDFTLTGFNTFLASPVGNWQHSSAGSQFGQTNPIWGVGMEPISFETVDGSPFELGASALLGRLDLGTDRSLSLDDLHTILQPNAALFAASGSSFDAIDPESVSLTFGSPEERRSAWWKPEPVAPEPVAPAPIVEAPLEIDPVPVETVPPVGTPVVVPEFPEIPLPEITPEPPTPPLQTEPGPPLEVVVTEPEITQPGFVEPAEITPPAPVIVEPIQITPAPVEPTPLPIETVEITPAAPEPLPPDSTPTEPAPVETAPSEEEDLPIETEPVVDPGPIESIPTAPEIPELVFNPDFPAIEPISPLYFIDLVGGIVPELSPILLDPTDWQYEIVAIDIALIDLIDYDRLVYDGAAAPVAFTDGFVLNRAVAEGEPSSLVPEPGAAILVLLAFATAPAIQRNRRIPHH